MTSVINVTRIAGAVEAVFDLISSARSWPEWHPASQAVFGVTERPYQLGNPMHERVHMAGAELLLIWRVVEHVRPSRVVLQALARPTRITYTLQTQGGALPQFLLVD